MKRGDGAARLSAQGWLPFQKHLVRVLPAGGKMPGFA